MRSNLVNCAVVGLGVGEQHANTILRNPLCNLSKIVELDAAKARQYLASNGLEETVLSSYHDVLADDAIQLISLASYDDHHYQQVVQALTRGKNVFVEKPMCQTTQQLLDIHKVWKESNCALASNLLLRTAPLYIYIKQLIETGQLGEIYAFDGDYLYGRMHKITEGWRKDVVNYSVMEGGGIHIIDLLLWLTQQLPETVISHANKIASKGTAFRYNDFQSSVFTFASGLIARITANFGCVHRHQHALRIFGTKGTFIHDDQGPRIHFSRDESSQPELLMQAVKPDSKGKLIEELVDHLHKKDFQSLAQREFNLMSVVLAADAAVNQLNPITIEYLTC